MGCRSDGNGYGWRYVTTLQRFGHNHPDGVKLLSGGRDAGVTGLLQVFGLGGRFPYHAQLLETNAGRVGVTLA